MQCIHWVVSVSCNFLGHKEASSHVVTISAMAKVGGLAAAPALCAPPTPLLSPWLLPPRALHIHTTRSTKTGTGKDSYYLPFLSHGDKLPAAYSGRSVGLLWGPTGQNWGESPLHSQPIPAKRKRRTGLVSSCRDTSPGNVPAFNRRTNNTHL